MLPLHHGPKRTTRIERAPCGGAPVLCRLSYVRRCARLESNQRACRIRAVLSTELRASRASGRS
jgi:hypothetical protein